MIECLAAMFDVVDGNGGGGDFVDAERDRKREKKNRVHLNYINTKN